MPAAIWFKSWKSILISEVNESDWCWETSAQYEPFCIPAQIEKAGAVIEVSDYLWLFDTLWV